MHVKKFFSFLVLLYSVKSKYVVLGIHTHTHLQSQTFQIRNVIPTKIKIWRKSVINQQQYSSVKSLLHANLFAGCLLFDISILITSILYTSHRLNKKTKLAVQNSRL